MAKSHLKVAKQRKDFPDKTAIWLLNQSLVIAHDNLNIQALAKFMLAKSVTDSAALASLLTRGDGKGE